MNDADIGKGDVVAARSPLFVAPPWGGPYSIAAGARATVTQVIAQGEQRMTCTHCGPKCAYSLKLAEYPLPPQIAWCPCEWRRIGGNQQDTVRLFAGHLKDAQLVTPGVFRRLTQA